MQNKAMDKLSNLGQQLESTKFALLGKLEQIRDQIRECNDEIHWLQNSPVPLGDVLARIDRFMADHAASLDLSYFFEANPINDLRLTAQGQSAIGVIRHVVGGQVPGVEIITTDLSNVLCTLYQDLTKAALIEQAKRTAKLFDPGPPLAERPELMEAAKQRRHVLEIEEEQLITQAEDAGLDGFFRRPDANPSIGFMLEVVEDA
jgi:hypothetical protein